jgi:hypothetical protein
MYLHVYLLLLILIWELVGVAVNYYYYLNILLILIQFFELVKGVQGWTILHNVVFDPTTPYVLTFKNYWLPLY